MKKKLLWPLLLSSAVLFGLGSAGNKFEPAVKKDPNNKFVAQYIERAEYIKAGSAVNAQIADEGMVLLKNKDNLLPFKDVHNVSIFGKASVELQYGGGGSGSGHNNGENNNKNIDMQKSLEDAGYTVNPTLTAFYKDNNKSEVQRTNGNTNWTGVSEATVGETSLVKYTDDVKASFSEYNDAAIIVLARGGTEGADCKTFDARDHDQAHDSRNQCTEESKQPTDKHYLELSKNEIDMIEMVKESFDKIVVLINSGNIFQCNLLENDDKIGGILWMGTPGAVGAGAVGRILSGAVNPSGKTVDTWTRDFREDPSFQNYGDNSQTYVIDGVAYAQDTMINPDGTPTSSATKARWADAEHHVANTGLNGVKPSAYVSYEEGIYVDYRYYESKYADMLKKDGKAAADEWYNGNKGVIYPFGYGLSYTSFSQKIIKADFDADTILTGKKKQMHVTVEVENTGAVAGKDVVQLYWHAPYIDQQIEKAEAVLCAFGKTKMLAPGEKDTVELDWYIQDVANYDYADANKNNFMGYELDGGDYFISINKSAHEAIETRSFKVQKDGIKYENDRFSGHKVENRFTNRGFYNSLPGKLDIGFEHMSRHDFDATFPHAPTIEERTLKEGSRAEEFLTHQFTLDDIEKTETYEYVPEAAHKTKEDIEALGWEQQASALSKGSRMQLDEMIGVPMDDPKWDEFLNQFTYAELQKFVEDGCFHSPALNNIGKRQTSDSDGPSQFAIIWWCGAPTVAATYNVELAKEQGKMVGTEAHINDKYGWFGPAVNTHRSPFGGRNFEYYAADPFLMGRMAANVVGEATKKGVYCYFKHFAVNDQEKGREGASSFVSEQALREIYLKSFQMVFEEGKSMGVMSSYNRLGLMETAASYPLLTEVLRGEWGFKGAVLSDMTHHGNSSFDHKCYENINYRALAGCNMQLDNSSYAGDIDAKWDNNGFDGKGCPVYTSKATGEKTETYSWWYAVRTLAKEVLWEYARSGGMDKDLALAHEGIKINDNEDAEMIIEMEIGKETSFVVSEGAFLSDKEDVVISFDRANPLPEGLVWDEEEMTVSGTPTKAGVTEIHFTAEYKENGKKAYIGKTIHLNVVDKTPDVEDKKSNGGKAGNVGAIIGITAGGVAAVAAIAAVVIILLKKKKVA